MANTGKRGRPPHDDALTPAEWRVAEAVRHGLTNRAIAERQGVSVDAIKYRVANVLQKLALPNRAALRQWDGVARDSALFSKEVEVNQALCLGKVGQISRCVKDITAARAWYGDLLGLKHLYSFGDLAFFDLGGTRLFLSANDSESKDESIIYFQVDDIRTAHAALAARGIEFINAPHMIHRHEDGAEEWMAFFKDNEARPLAIMATVRG